MLASSWAHLLQEILLQRFSMGPQELHPRYTGTQQDSDAGHVRLTIYKMWVQPIPPGLLQLDFVMLSLVPPLFPPNQDPSFQLRQPSFIEHLQFVKQDAKNFACIISLNHRNNPLKWVLFFFSI